MKIFEKLLPPQVESINNEKQDIKSASITLAYYSYLCLFNLLNAYTILSSSY